MSRLQEVMENHHRLDELTGLFKHHGVNAEFVAEATVRHLELEQRGGGDHGAAEPPAESAEFRELLEDLRQFQARF